MFCIASRRGRSWHCTNCLKHLSSLCVLETSTVSLLFLLGALFISILPKTLPLLICPHHSILNILRLSDVSVTSSLFFSWEEIETPSLGSILYNNPELFPLFLTHFKYNNWCFSFFQVTIRLLFVPYNLPFLASSVTIPVVAPVLSGEESG